MPNLSQDLDGSSSPPLELDLDPSLETERHAHTFPPTTPPTRPKYYYFAYGSNLSYTQMGKRCNNFASSTPLVVAKLHHWRWLICQPGYANVLPPSGLRVPIQDSDDAHEIPVAGSADAVYGILYEMDVDDEKVLDMYEGVDPHAQQADGEFVDVDVRPMEQGSGSYNKWFVEADVVEWFDPRQKEERVTALVYVDENCVKLSPPKQEYIARMNRAINESVQLGVPRKWVNEVIRKFIPGEYWVE